MTMYVTNELKSMIWYTPLLRHYTLGLDLLNSYVLAQKGLRIYGECYEHVYYTTNSNKNLGSFNIHTSLYIIKIKLMNLILFTRAKLCSANKLSQNQLFDQKHHGR